MSTYTEWRFCWLPRRSQRFSTVEEDRKLIGTHVFQWNDPELPYALVYFLDKMAKSVTRDAIAFPEKDQYHMHFDQTTISWKRLETLYNAKGFPEKGQKTFFAYARLGSGAEGTVWKGCDPKGNACAIKVFDKRYETSESEEKAALAKELHVWHEIYGVQGVFQVTLTNVPALIMPILDQPQTWNNQQKEAVKAAVKKYSLTYFATDLKRDHVGFHTINGQLEAILFDTSPITLEERRQQLREEETQRAAKKNNRRRPTQVEFSAMKAEEEMLQALKTLL